MVLRHDRLAERPLKKFAQGGDEGVGIDPLRLQRLPAREGQQPARQRPRPLHALKRERRRLLDPRSCLRLGKLRHLAVDRVETAEDDGQHVVEVVRHAAGELAQRIHLLRLTELLLKSAPLGHVVGADHDAAGIALLARNRRRHRLDDLAGMDPLVAKGAAPAVEAGAKIAVDLRARDGAERLDRRSPRQLVRLPAVKAGQSRIDLLEAEAVTVLHQHGVVFRRVPEERPDERLARGELGRPLGDPALERVVDPRQLLLGALRVGDVVRHADIADVLAGEAPAGLRLRLHPAPLAVGAAEARLDLDRLRRPVDDRRGCANARQVFRMQGVAPVEGERRFVSSAEEVEIGLVDELAPVVGPGHPDEHRRAVGDGAEARLAFGDRALGELALGDVADDHIDADHAPARVAVGHVHDLGEGGAARARELDLVATSSPASARSSPSRRRRTSRAA